MKFIAESVEYWSQNQVETVFFGNEEKALALVMSKTLGATENYLEWNDQSNACYNGVKKVQLSPNELQVELLPEAAKQLGEAGFEVEFECEAAILKQVKTCLKLIFEDKYTFVKAAAKPKTAPAKDYSNIRYLNLEGKKLKQLPDYVREMTALETAILAHNPKLDLQSSFEILGNFPNLQELTISAEGPIPESIGKLTRLETLNIYDLNKPSSLPENFGQLKRLKNLLIMGDGEVAMPESFAELTELEDLNLRINGWNLPSRFYQLAKLKWLDLSNCTIAHFPSEIAQMANVERVIFGNKNGTPDFARIMPIVAQMPNVKTLEFDMHPIPKEIKLCKNIEELIIWAGADRDTPLQLPDELFELTQLQVLIMSRNYFAKIPDGIGRMKGLKTLVLSECEFESLPDSIGELSNLEFLNLSENPALKSLPEGLGNLTQLKALHLEELPQLTELPLSLSNLTNLESVRLSNRETVKNVPASWDQFLTTA